MFEFPNTPPDYNNNNYTTLFRFRESFVPDVLQRATVLIVTHQDEENQRAQVAGLYGGHDGRKTCFQEGTGGAEEKR